MKPRWEGPYPIIVSTPTAIKVSGVDSWMYLSQVKLWTPAQEDDEAVLPSTESPDSYLCDPLGPETSLLMGS